VQTQARTKGITERFRATAEATYGRPVQLEDVPIIEVALGKLVIFAKLEKVRRVEVAKLCTEREVPAGDQLIRQGETGLATDEMYIVKSGHFEVLESRHGSMMMVNQKYDGDIFGELSLMYSTPRTATVQASRHSIVWVLSRQVFRQLMKTQNEMVFSQREVFLNSVPMLNSLSREERLRIADAFKEREFQAGATVMKQGDKGKDFFIITEGEAKVFVETTDESGSSSTMKVNELFRADFFGERALLKDEPRMASVIVSSAIPMKCLVLARKDFVEILGPLQELMEREKSAVTTNKRMKELSGDLKHKKVSVILKRTSPRLGAVQIVCKGSAEEMLLLAKQNSGGNVVRAQRYISAAFSP